MPAIPPYAQQIAFLKSQLDDLTVPDDFICPLSKKIMQDPVTAPSGHTYDRDALTQCFGKRDTINDPECKEYTIAVSILKNGTNVILKKQIERFIAEQHRKLKPHNTVLPQIITLSHRELKTRLSAHLKVYEKAGNFIDKLAEKLTKKPAAVTDLETYVETLTDSNQTLLSFEQSVALAKIVYGLELLYVTAQDKQLQNNLGQFIDELFGERSAGFRELYTGKFWDYSKTFSNSDPHTLYKDCTRSNNPWTKDMFKHFNLTVITKLCLIPPNCTQAWACLMHHRGASEKMTHIVCSLTPNQFQPAYLDFLGKQIKWYEHKISGMAETALTRKDFAADILYGFYWLQQGDIATQTNKDKVIYYAESMSCLAFINPDVAQLSLIEIQEKYQTIFNRAIQQIAKQKEQILLSGSRQSQTGRVLWHFFGTKAHSKKLNHPLSEEKIITHIVSFLVPRPRINLHTIKDSNEEKQPALPSLR
jgi:hypothetical protein